MPAENDSDAFQSRMVSRIPTEWNSRLLETKFPAADALDKADLLLASAEQTKEQLLPKDKGAAMMVKLRNAVCRNLRIIRARLGSETWCLNNPVMREKMRVLHGEITQRDKENGRQVWAELSHHLADVQTWSFIRSLSPLERQCLENFGIDRDSMDNFDDGWQPRDDLLDAAAAVLFEQGQKDLQGLGYQVPEDEAALRFTADVVRWRLEDLLDRSEE